MAIAPQRRRHPGQLVLPWAQRASMGEMSLAEMVETVIGVWSAAVVEGVMSAQTFDKFSLLARRFERFAAAHNVITVDSADSTLVSKFVRAPGRSRHGNVAAAAVATMHNRRATLRALYNAALTHGQASYDPTAGIAIPRRETSIQRPVTDDEAAIIRLVCQREQPTRHAATAALLLLGAHTGELGHIATGDVNAAAAIVQAHGSTKHQPRNLPLDRWSQQVLVARIAYLTRPLPAGSPSPVLCTGAAGSDAHRQARVCVTVREILTRAGLSDDPGIRPSSLTAYAARRVFDRTGRVEAAAALIGSRSLDSTAALIGYQWSACDV
ncbi:integrase [Mycobacteriaceae bacterium NPDC060252]